MHPNRLGVSSFLILFAGVATLLFFVFAPFIPLLALAAVFAVLLQNPYEHLVRLCAGWKNVATSIMVILVLVLFIVPLLFLGAQVFQEAQRLYISLQGSGVPALTEIEKLVTRPLQDLFPGFVINLDGFVTNALGFISSNLGSLVYKTLFVIFDSFLMLLALYFFLRDGRAMLSSFVEISPFGKEATTEILNNMYRTIRSIIQGTLFNALLRWLAIGAAFYVFNIPNAALWSSVGGIVGAIPGLGTPFAFVPAALYLYSQGDMLGVLGLTLWAILVMVLIDNVLTSYFFGKGLSISPVFVLFSILGGIVFLGPLGFILGPLILSVFLSIVHVYRITREENNVSI